MKYESLIFRVDFQSMVEKADSLISISVFIPAIHFMTTIEDRESIKHVSKEYEFLIAGANQWGVSPLIKRECLIEFEDCKSTFFHFLS